jgi:hypothetical protein
MGSGGATVLEARGDNQDYNETFVSYWIGVLDVSAKARKVTAATNNRRPTSLNDGEYFFMRRGKDTFTLSLYRTLARLAILNH